MTSNTSHAIKARKEAKDVFYTPLLVAQTHISQIKHKEEDMWFDPFYGKGIYYDNFPTTKKDFTEIALGKDFFTSDVKPDIICSNPPYSMVDEVLQKSVEMNPRIISYLLLQGKMTPKRLEFMKQHNYGLTAVYTCKVYQWYGMAEAYTFEKGVDSSTVSHIWDRIVHRTE